jgi:hypothetical protein
MVMQVFVEAVAHEILEKAEFLRVPCGHSSLEPQ